MNWLALDFLGTSILCFVVFGLLTINTEADGRRFSPFVFAFLTFLSMIAISSSAGVLIETL